jgi:hypothetical protein
MRVESCSLREANKFVALWHRHHKPTVGHRFSLHAVNDSGEVVGAAIIGRPVARALDADKVVEVNRLVTNGTRNACSMLYAAAAREASKRGFTHIITYILATEPGTSLMACGWEFEAKVKGRSWSRESRLREEENPLQCQDKTRWGRSLSPPRLRPNNAQLSMF